MAVLAWTVVDGSYHGNAAVIPICEGDGVPIDVFNPCHRIDHARGRGGGIAIDGPAAVREQGLKVKGPSGTVIVRLHEHQPADGLEGIPAHPVIHLVQQRDAVKGIDGVRVVIERMAVVAVVHTLAVADRDGRKAHDAPAVSRLPVASLAVIHQGHRWWERAV